VLIVEDDPFVRGYAVGCVESLGYRVMTAANGPEALSKLASHGDEVDILFSDVVMPGGIGGWDLAERARKSRPKLKVLLTSGYQMETLTGRIGAISNVTIINKPYRKSELGRKLKQVLEL
jgi:CheY-like chemotaxis protein